MFTIGRNLLRQDSCVCLRDWKLLTGRMEEGGKDTPLFHPLILFNFYDVKNTLKQLGFWYDASEISNKFPILEHHIRGSLSNRIFLERLSSILNIQFCDCKRVLIL